MRKFAAVLLSTILSVSLSTSSVLADTSNSPPSTNVNTTTPSAISASSSVIPTRLAGDNRYLTAIAISKAGWPDASAENVFIARADNFPDALAGAVLAKKNNAPLLLTDQDQLRPEVTEEITRLGATHVYLLGSDGALSEENVAKPLRKLTVNGTPLTVDRIKGNNRYETAAAIATAAGAPNHEAFLVTGDNFADALSVSSFAAANNIPILMTKKDSIPDATQQTIKDLGIKSITIIGSNGVISDPLQKSLEVDGYAVTRIAGANRYETNYKVNSTLSFARTGAFVATGETFPDALAGSVLAGVDNQPIVLIKDGVVPASATDYLKLVRSQLTGLTILGSYGLIPYDAESILCSGSLKPRISLQYMNGASLTSPLGMLNQLATIPSPATDYVDIIAPSWFSLSGSDGTITGVWDTTSDNYAQIVNRAHASNLKVLPTVNSSWASSAVIDAALANPSSRTQMVNQIVQRIKDLNLDGIVIDYEFMGDQDGPNLTAFMQELYTKLHSINKLVIMAVMSITDLSKQPWYAELNYHDLSQTVDYLNIMTYDYSTSRPGPISPIDWVQDVLNYAKSQGVDMHKVLMGIPYYGTDWWIDSAGNWHSQARGLYTLHSTTPDNDIDGAMDRYDLYKDSSETLIERDAGQIPFYSYTNEQGQHTVYFDDQASWNAKLALLNKYDLGGIAAWSLFWANNPDTENVIFPLLKQYLR